MNRVTHIPTAATSAMRISAPRRLWICRVGDSCCAPAHNPWITPARNPGKEDISNEIRLRTFLMWFDIALHDRLIAGARLCYSFTAFM